MKKTTAVMAATALAFAGSIFLIATKKAPEVGSSVVVVVNETSEDADVFFAFGADSAVLPGHWTFCPPSSRLNCSFHLAARSSRALPLLGRYLNATISFEKPVGCGSTKAELNVNNPKWFDVADVSLVDGYSNGVAIEVSDRGGQVAKLGPPAGASGNEKTYGVYPLGCDVCIERKSPPCGIPAGKDGCKAGTESKPDVPCQFQGLVLGGGSSIRVSLVQTAAKIRSN